MPEGDITCCLSLFPSRCSETQHECITYCSKGKYWKCAVWGISPSCNKAWSDVTFTLFLATEFFYGDHFKMKGRQKTTLWKGELGALLKVNWQLKIVAFCHGHPEWNRNPWFTALSETRIILWPFHLGVPPWHVPGMSCQPAKIVNCYSFIHTLH